jgi:hypothetical protein
MVRSVCGLIALALLLSTSPRSVKGEPDNIDVILLKNVPLLVQQLKEAGIRNFGVLPFRLKAHSDVERTAGALIQTNLAARTEQVIAYVRDVDDPVNVVFNMLGQARQQDPQAAYDSEDRIARILSFEYAFPVEEMAKTTLDGFVTGSIEVSEDWKQTTLHFEYYSAKSKMTGRSLPIVFPTDRKMLLQLGRGFSLTAAGWNARGLGVQSRNIFAKLAEDEQYQKSQGQSAGSADSAARVGTDIAGNPWAKFPVTLAIKYDGQSQDIKWDTYASSFNFTLADPKPKQRVTFEIKNNMSEKLAVVLAINGKSLIYNQNANDPDSCSKFVLEGGKTYSIPGVYQEGLKSFQPLLGFDDTATPDLVKRFPADAAGLIHVIVYREVSAEDPGRITHFVSDGDKATSPTKSGSPTKNDSVAKNDSAPKSGSTAKGSSATETASPAGKTNNSPSQKVEFFNVDESETWYNSFHPNLVRSGTNQQSGRGSFHPTPSSTKAKTWKELFKGIGQNALQMNTSRGLIAPGGEAQQQSLATLKLGAVNQTDVAIIRYLSVAQF